MAKSSKPLSLEEAENIERELLKNNPDKKPIPIGSILQAIGKSTPKKKAKKKA